ncbi:alanine--tRNA ligase, partial [Patescibacteria group bacterium]|nr:alanine--tRNA ligase [Patescibacteria group bacterium]
QSRAGAEQKFAGGLADHSEPVVRQHTATHLLLAALRDVLGDGIKQRGSNITKERLRFDFSYPEKLTDEQRNQVEALVNEWIKEDLPVVRKEMPREEAERLGAQMEFGHKYPDVVSVYFIGEPDSARSMEFCGGPHVEHTGEIGTFTLKKQESVGAGVRRIKAVIKP